MQNAIGNNKNGLNAIWFYGCRRTPHRSPMYFNLSGSCMNTIAFIAPNKKLFDSVCRVVEEEKYPITVLMGDMETGVEQTQKALQEGAKIIISRGGTALNIGNALNIEVISVRPSSHSVFDYLYNNTTEKTRIAFVGFSPFIKICRPICDILHREYKEFEISNPGVAGLIMDQVLAWKPDVVVGDTISVRWASSKDFKIHLVESNRDSIIDACEQAILVRNNLNKHIAAANKLAVVLNCAQEGALLVNTEGFIEEVNQQSCLLLQKEREALLNTSVHAIFTSEELSSAIRSGTKLTSIVSVNGTDFAVDTVISPPYLEANSIVLLFQRVEHILQKENIVRQKLRESGFIAKYTFSDIIHASATMQQTITKARQYAAATCSIIIQGETGTGKELFAQSIHNSSTLAKGPFVAVNCGAIPKDLLESELFGYAPGAFTGAMRSGKPGLFELSHGGTLFLDEITEMDFFLQTRLLRILQAREVMRIGDNKVIPINVRVIAATNRNPAEEVAAGRLRADLYYRLNVLDLKVPPLRDRQEDIPLLFNNFVRQYAKQYTTAAPKAGKDLQHWLSAYSWPGNVRELENLAEKFIILRGDISCETITAQPVRSGAEIALHEGDGRLDTVIGNYIHMVIDQCEGKIARAAQKLDVDRNTVKRWLARCPTKKE